MANLAPRCRRLVEMLFFESPARPYTEVASELNLAVGSIGLTRRNASRVCANSSMNWASYEHRPGDAASRETLIEELARTQSEAERETILAKHEALLSPKSSPNC